MSRRQEAQNPGGSLWVQSILKFEVVFAILKLATISTLMIGMVRPTDKRRKQTLLKAT